ncbi:hypothetical protein [Aureibacter tunicatorum]|uniref:Uncharacterized protein n=1 Tax=Aureibacter tunicatorum TaxID=866807 RepID=A0AAE4BSM1_9BACT|nr:hypothetical protein [Aureibacter tunicatorum]MDR6239921.1 hypothetical protein [Aureibacter tunicatorum]BDD04396.1 hypothetical protein AUTU_18790 [Aureibacter tunicatorum]
MLKFEGKRNPQSKPSNPRAGLQKSPPIQCMLTRAEIVKQLGLANEEDAANESYFVYTVKPNEREPVPKRSARRFNREKFFDFTVKSTAKADPKYALEASTTKRKSGNYVPTASDLTEWHLTGHAELLDILNLLDRYQNIDTIIEDEKLETGLPRRFPDLANFCLAEIPFKRLAKRLHEIRFGRQTEEAEVVNPFLDETDGAVDDETIRACKIDKLMLPALEKYKSHQRKRMATANQRMEIQAQDERYQELAKARFQANEALSEAKMDLLERMEVKEYCPDDDEEELRKIVSKKGEGYVFAKLRLEKIEKQKASGLKAEIDELKQKMLEKQRKFEEADAEMTTAFGSFADHANEEREFKFCIRLAENLEDVYRGFVERSGREERRTASVAASFQGMEPDDSEEYTPALMLENLQEERKQLEAELEEVAHKLSVAKEDFSGNEDVESRDVLIGKAGDLNRRIDQVTRQEYLYAEQQGENYTDTKDIEREIQANYLLLGQKHLEKSDKARVYRRIRELKLRKRGLSMHLDQKGAGSRKVDEIPSDDFMAPRMLEHELMLLDESEREFLLSSVELKDNGDPTYTREEVFAILNCNPPLAKTILEDEMEYATALHKKLYRDLFYMKLNTTYLGIKTQGQEAFGGVREFKKLTVSEFVDLKFAEKYPDSKSLLEEFCSIDVEGDALSENIGALEQTTSRLVRRAWFEGWEQADLDLVVHMDNLTLDLMHAMSLEDLIAPRKETYEFFDQHRARLKKAIMRFFPYKFELLDTPHPDTGAYLQIESYSILEARAQLAKQIMDQMDRLMTQWKRKYPSGQRSTDPIVVNISKIFGKLKSQIMQEKGTFKRRIKEQESAFQYIEVHQEEY